MGGGIIIGRNAAILVALTDPSWYQTLCQQRFAHEKKIVDAINAKEPAARTEADLDTLYDILGRIKGC